MTLYDQFIYEVEKGILLSNDLVKKAVKRHQKDLKRSKTRKFPYKFDTEKADLAVAFIKSLRHTIGSVSGQLFILKPYHAFIVGSIFGWVHKKTGYRRFRRVYVEMARKGVKSELAAGIALYAMVMDGEYAPQIYTIATQKEQAKIVFVKAVQMIRKLTDESPKARQQFRIMGGDRPDRIIYYKNEGFMEAFSSESKKKDGHDPHLVVCDEYHAHNTDEMLNVMTSGMGSRKNPITLIITTAGFNINGPCYEERTNLVSILDGLYENDSIFGIIWTLDKDDDWHDRTKWVKAAPNIGETPTWEFMEENYKLALMGSSKEVEFKTKLLNIWNNSSATWIPDREVKRVMQKIDLSLFKGRPCIGSLDLAFSASGDIVSYSLLFLPTEDDIKYYAFHYYFVSDEKIYDQRRSDRVNYLQWYNDGHLIKVPGNIIDYAYVKEVIFQTAEQFQLKAIVADRFNTSQLIVDLVESGLTVLPFGQGFVSMNTPIDEAEIMIKSKKIVINESPVTRWMFRNAKILFDSSGNKKLDRSNQKNKIDGIATLLMSIGGAKDKNITQQTYTGAGPVLL